MPLKDLAFYGILLMIKEIFNKSKYIGLNEKKIDNIDLKLSALNVFNFIGCLCQ